MAKAFLFIDARVEAWQALLLNLDPDVEVLLDPLADGVWQIANVLRGHTGLSSISIVSHGAEGALPLGSAPLATSSLDCYARHLRDIGSALSESGDILLYGCSVAPGEASAYFRQELSDHTGSDVAESTNLTRGNARGCASRRRA